MENNIPAKTSNGYRPDVDGLRAIAVLGVLLFHAELNVPGGFVGVDVFFVISGFLIASIIFRKLAAGQWDIFEFWARRVRRILPALVVMSLVTIAIGMFLLFPRDLKKLAASEVASSLSLSNFFFYWTSGYFAPDANIQPLLHTWSLAVEEQFYLVIPWLLVAIKSFSYRRQLASLWVLLVASFLLCEFVLAYDADLAFYSSPTRAWELLVGVVLACHTRSGHKLSRKSVAEAGAWLGIGLVLLSMALFSENTRFPGTAAILPCVGSALIILCNNGNLTVVGRLLAARWMIGLGLISYSVYLWHWPLLAYVRYWFFGLGSLETRISLVAASIGLGWLSWRFVETPFRTPHTSHESIHTIRNGLKTIGACCSVALPIYFLDGIPARYSAPVLRHQSAYSEIPKRSFDLALDDVKAGNLNRVWQERHDGSSHSVLIWGDSHVRALVPTLDGITADASAIFYASSSATAPIFEYGTRDQKAWNDAVWSAARAKDIRSILLVGKWEKYLLDDESYNHLAATARAIHNTGVKIAIFRQVPEQEFDVPRALSISLVVPSRVPPRGISKTAYSDSISNRYLTQLAETCPWVNVIDTTAAFFDGNEHSKIQEGGWPLYYDNHHVTKRGAQKLLPLIDTTINILNTLD